MGWADSLTIEYYCRAADQQAAEGGDPGFQVASRADARLICSTPLADAVSRIADMSSKGAKVVEVAVEAGMLDMIKDAVLFQGSFSFMFYVCLAGFCLANSRMVLKDANLYEAGKSRINYFHGCVLMVLMSFGGSTIAAVMCGKPVPFVCNEALVPVCLICWTVAYLDSEYLKGMVNKLLSENDVGAVLSSILWEIMRCHVAMNCSAMAQGAKLVATRDLAIIGPLIAGTLGGCGGGFMPLNKGLDPLKNGTNWRIGSAVINSIWLFASMQYPSTKASIGLSAPSAKFVAICICVIPPLIQMAYGFKPLGPNPLVTGPVTGPKASDPKAKAS